MRRPGVVLFALGAAIAAAALTQVSPHGPDLQLNDVITGAQQHVKVAVGDGQLLAVWESVSTAGSDTDGLSIQGRRYAADGSAIGGQFQVNEWTTGNQSYPSVASNGGSNFVVVFASSAFYTGDDSAIVAQILNLDRGTSTTFQVNSYTTNLQRKPAIAMNASGNFVVVWESGASPTTDSSGFSIQARRYFNGGSPAGPQFQVNSYTSLAQVTPAVAIDAAGAFVVTWHNFIHTLDPSGSVHSQKFDPDGNPVGFEEMVNSHTTNAQNAPVVAATGGGEFVVAWESNGEDGDNYGIEARRIAASGIPTGYSFHVNSNTAGAQRFPAIASDTFGNFVVVWQSETSTGSDTSSLSIQARQFRRDDSPVYPDRQVNAYTTSLQQTPGVDTDSLGDFVAVWEGFGSGGSDHDGFSAHGRRFDGLFSDGFENGSDSRWSPGVF